MEDLALLEILILITVLVGQQRKTLRFFLNHVRINMKILSLIKYSDSFLVFFKLKNMDFMQDICTSGMIKD